MLRQIRYFQAVVQNNSFSEAAEECHVTQSAISQQIRTLEQELGFSLLYRKNRSFSLTPAGEHFYKESLILVANYERIYNESLKISNAQKNILKLGFLRGYNGLEIQRALEEFLEEYPEVSVQIVYGNHGELHRLLCKDDIDLALNERREIASDEYVSQSLGAKKEYVEISSKNPISGYASVTSENLEKMSCILISSEEEISAEKKYYRTLYGFQGDFLCAENLEEARLMVICGQGFLITDGAVKEENIETSICRIPFYWDKKQMLRIYCVLWKKDTANHYVETFADILKSKCNSYK